MSQKILPERSQNKPTPVKKKQDNSSIDGLYALVSKL